MGSRGRSGLFGHAKYSDTIIRNIPESVRKAAREDIAAIIDPSLANTRIIPGRKRSLLDFKNNGVEKIFSQTEVQNNHKPKQKQNFVTRIEPLENTLSTPNMKRPHVEAGNNLNQQQKQNLNFGGSKKINFKKIAAKIQDSHPTITLRSDEPRTLSDATFSLVKNALSARKEKSVTQQRLSPFRTLSDQTMYLGEQKDDKDKTEQDINFRYLDESPTAEMELSLGECSSAYPLDTSIHPPPIQQSFSSQLPEEYDDNFNIYSNRFDESFDVLGEDEDQQQQQSIDDIECNSGTVYPFSFF